MISRMPPDTLSVGVTNTNTRLGRLGMITMNRFGVRWSVLVAHSRWLFIGSMVAVLIAIAPLPFQDAFYSRTIFYDLGYDLDSGGEWPKKIVAAPVALEAWATLWFIGFSTVSALLWWRLSVRQDELFNRVQNWALAMGGVWSATLLTVWSVLDLANIVPPATPLFIINAFVLSICVFWFVAVRRWA